LSQNIKKKIKKQRNLSYLQKDFNSFRDELVLYAKQHYPDKIMDFSESSLAGLFVDLAAYVGDSLSYYLDHQFNELFLDTAIENENVERLVRLNGVKIRGAAPANVELTFEMTVPATLVEGVFVPDRDNIPKINARSIFSSNSGVEFELLDNLDFAELDSQGELIATIADTIYRSNGTIESFIISRNGICTSAKTETESIVISDELIPFRTITIENTDVSEIISVIDTEGDEYYEVESLTQDTVFQRFDNTRLDTELVPQRIKIIPAPRRYVTARSTDTGQTTLRFGAGNDEIFDEDIIPDPSLNAIQLYGDRKTFSTISVDPNNFLKTATLGIAPRNTTLKITYRYGGGLADNVTAGEIQNVKVLRTSFNSSVPFNIAANIRESVTAINLLPAVGGEDEPSLQELKLAAILGANTQGRIVTREDLISRVYTMPANFGRVFRCTVRDNPNNPLAAQLFIISRDRLNNLILSPDTLKENLALYLSKHRLISDSIDIVDANIVNFEVVYTVTIQSGFLNDQVIQKINFELKEYFKVENFQIGQPIIVSQVENLILNVLGVQSILSLELNNINGFKNSRLYSNFSYSFNRNLDRGMLFPPRGGIFELKYLDDDIKGNVG
jgi:uncharacterized phage protein gp47/JayE